jgi:hypothetical protein
VATAPQDAVLGPFEARRTRREEPRQYLLDL